MGIASSSRSVRTTYALDLGVIAPLCLAGAWAVSSGAPLAMRLAVPILGFGILSAVAALFLRRSLRGSAWESHA